MDAAARFTPTRDPLPRRSLVSSADLAPLAGERILITGAAGMLGRSFVEALSVLSSSPVVLARSHQQLDVTDPQRVMSLAAMAPTIIVHCAGLTSADRCERDPALARLVHVEGTRNVVRLAEIVSARILYPQSVFIFDGHTCPVTERTVPAPPFEYGRVKLEAERLVMDSSRSALTVRMAGFFGGDRADKNFVGQFTHQLGAMLASGETSCEVGDRIWQPTYTLDLAANALLLLARGKTGVYHMGALGEASFAEVAQACVEELDLAGRIDIRPTSAEAFAAREAAPRPSRMVTANERLDDEGLNRQRPWREALAEYLHRPFFDPLRTAQRRSG